MERATEASGTNGGGWSATDRLAEAGHDEPEELVIFHDQASGLRAVVSVHSTVLGPALGGCRFHPYPSIGAAVNDAVRLGWSMTGKAALAGLDLGGGKAVIMGDPRAIRTEALLEAFGRRVESLGGRYITAEDVGTCEADMDVIGRVTGWVVGRSPEQGGAGDPSPATALGVFEAMRATVNHATGSDDLAGVRVTVVGVGKVGRPLVERLVADGAVVFVADVDDAAVASLVDQLGVEPVATADALTTPCDVLSPCALGGVLNASTIPQLRCTMVVGSANNQLGEDADAQRLADLGIVYAPDFLVNAGGLIHVADELHGYDEERVATRVRGIGKTTTRLFHEAEEHGMNPLVAAERLAQQRIDDRRAELAGDALTPR
jgi:valine dehydrogenase (NAD+)